MPSFVIPYKLLGKTRLGDPELAEAMCRDVIAACRELGDVSVADAPGGQGKALLAAAPAIVPAADGTTNAIALAASAQFKPLYGRKSARRFERALGARVLDLSGLVDDVDTWDDLRRLADRVGPFTR